MYPANMLTIIVGAAVAALALDTLGAWNLLGASMPSFRHNACITHSNALQAAEIYRRLIHAYTDTLASEALTEDFVDWSSTVNIIRNKGHETPFNLTAATFTGRQDFMAGQGAQPPIAFETLGIWHGCDSVSVRWMTTRSASGQLSEVASMVSDFATNDYVLRTKLTSRCSQ